MISELYNWLYWHIGAVGAALIFLAVAFVIPAAIIAIVWTWLDGRARK